MTLNLFMSGSVRPNPALMSRKIRVLHLINSLNYGGMERILADIVRRTDPSRFDKHILALSYLGRFAKDLENVATLHVARHMSPWSLLWPRTLARQIQRIAPDVVHTHSGVWYKASLAARLAGVRRLIHTEHGRPNPDYWHRKFFEWLAAKRTDVIVAVSEPLAQYHLADSIVRERHKICIILNGVDTDLYCPRPDPGTVRRELGIDAMTPVLGSIGRFEIIKGYALMVQAFRRLHSEWKNGPAPILVLAGEGTERGHLETLVASYGLRDRISFLGWRDDVHDLHATFTLFTLASRSEGTSISLLEAMSSGLCPVVTNVGGNADVLGKELRHRLVPPEDPDALANAWKNALQDVAKRDSDAQAARSRVKAYFGLDSMVKSYERLYVMDD
jgi:glycosyltransferase involved in cell wall biosynthesis